MEDRGNNTLTSYEQLSKSEPESTTRENHALKIDARVPVLKRVIYFIIGLACIVLPVLEMRQSVSELGWASIFFSLIVAGAVFIGATFILGAIAIEGLIWTFRDQILYLHRQSVWHRKTDIIRAKNILRISVRKVDWDLHVPTYRVALYLKSGAFFETPDHSLETAEKLAAEFCMLLAFAEKTTF